jgi:hypothetical protein
MISYFFCKLFKIVRAKQYIVLPDKTFKEIKIKNIHNVIYFRKENKYYSIIKVVDEIVNTTIIYTWIYVEEII